MAGTLDDEYQRAKSRILARMKDEIRADFDRHLIQALKVSAKIEEEQAARPSLTLNGSES